MVTDPTLSGLLIQTASGDWLAQGGTNFLVLFSSMLCVGGLAVKFVKPLVQSYIETMEQIRRAEIEQHRAFAEQLARTMDMHTQEHREILAEVRRLRDT